MRRGRLCVLSVGLLFVMGFMVGPSAGDASAAVGRTPCPGRVEEPQYNNPATKKLVQAHATVKCSGGERLEIKGCLQVFFNHDWRSITNTACDKATATQGRETTVSMLMDTLCDENRYRTAISGVHYPPDRPAEGYTKYTDEVKLLGPPCESGGQKSPPEPHTPCSQQQRPPGSPPC